MAERSVILGREARVVTYHTIVDDVPMRVDADWYEAQTTPTRSQGWILRPNVETSRPVDGNTDRRDHVGMHQWELIARTEIFVPGDNATTPDSAVRRLVRALQEHRSAVEQADAHLLDVVRSLITPAPDGEGANEGDTA